MKAGWIKYKTSKYEKFKELEKERYSVIVKAVEIGARGFVEGTQYQILFPLGTKMEGTSEALWFCIGGDGSSHAITNCLRDPS